MERFLRLKEVAEAMGTSPDNARATLARYGVFPIDYGIGRSRGYRWLQSAVNAAMVRMAADAQPAKQTATKPRKTKASHLALASMSVNDLHNYLTQAALVQ